MASSCSRRAGSGTGKLVTVISIFSIATTRSSRLGSVSAVNSATPYTGSCSPAGVTSIAMRPSIAAKSVHVSICGVWTTTTPASLSNVRGNVIGSGRATVSVLAVSCAALGKTATTRANAAANTTPRGTIFISGYSCRVIDYEAGKPATMSPANAGDNVTISRRAPSRDLNTPPPTLLTSSPEPRPRSRFRNSFPTLPPRDWHWTDCSAAAPRPC